MRELIAGRAAQRPRRREDRIFSGPVLFGRTRRDIAELIGWAWLAIEIARLVRVLLDERHMDSRADQVE